MTSKLKCLFCEYELQENRTTNLCCPICGLVAPTKLWQALIQSQQDLEESQQATIQNAQTVLEIHKDLDIARKALEELIAYYDHYDSFDGEISWDGVALIMRNDAHEALEQITHDNSEKANSGEQKE